MRTKIGILILGILLTITTLYAQDSLGVRKVGSIYNSFSNANSIVTSGNIVFLGGTGLRVLNIERPDSAFQVAYRGGYSIRVMASQGNFLYLIDWNRGLIILNVSDPANPIETGSLLTTAGRVRVSGSFAYLLHPYSYDFYSTMTILNISNPSNPQLASSFDVAYGFPASDFYIANDRMYVTQMSTGFCVFSVTNPYHPVLLGSTSPITGNYNYVTVVDSFAYVSNGTRGLSVLDISNPANITLVADYNSTNSNLRNVGPLTLSSHYFHAYETTEGMRILDFSNPRAILDCGAYCPNGYIAISDNKSVIAYENGLRIYNLTNPVLPSLFRDYQHSLFLDVAVSNQYAYVANGTEGLRIVDVSNRANPVEVGHYNTPGDALSVTLSGGLAFVADRGAGVRIVNVTNPTNPNEIGFFDTPGSASDIKIIGNNAFIADYTSGLQIVNISNPASPTLIGSYDTPGYGWAVEIIGNYAFVADLTRGVRVIDVSNLSSPVEVCSSMTAYQPCDIAIVDSFAYVACRDSGLVRVDIRNPMAPRVMQRCDTPGNAFRVTIAGQNAYVADGYGGIRIIYIGDPNRLPEVGFYDTPVYTEGVAVAGNHAFVADYYSMGIYDCSQALPVIDRVEGELPSAFALHANYPNPFNATTTLLYDLPLTAKVKLTVFDITGRTVATLVDFHQNAGSYSILWNASQLPSGTYFIRLQANHFTANLKLVLLK